MTMALLAPQTCNWREFAASNLLNPEGKKIDEQTYREVEAAVASYAQLVSDLGREAAATQSAELGELQKAGVAVTLAPGDVPSKKAGKDAVWSTDLTGRGIAASKANMPRLREVEGRISMAGKSMALAVIAVMAKKGFVDATRVEALRYLIETNFSSK